MSFLDDQATGQIGIGEKAGLSTLTRRKRKRKKGQAPMGTETYSLLPQNEFSNIVSKPSDITQVGIGKDLLKQGTAASEVPNVFEQYKTAAPIGSTMNALYPQPEDDEPDDDDIIDELESDPLPDFNSPDAGGLYDPGGALDPLGPDAYPNAQNPDGTDKTFSEVVAGMGTGITDLFSFMSTAAPTNVLSNMVQNAARAVTGGQPISLEDTNPFNRSGSDAGDGNGGGRGFGGNEGSGTTADGGFDMSNYGGSGASGGGGGSGGAYDPSISEYGEADGGVITKSKAKNKNSFVSMKGK